jgi:succinate dehydrogenase (ubiquinone) membrane anchor subunit
MATSTLRSPALRQLFTPTTARSARTIFAPRFQLQRAQFQTSARRNILPPLPQVIRGGVNDPAPVPESHPSHGSYHWSMERCVESIQSKTSGWNAY